MENNQLATFDLTRFLQAQEEKYVSALAELKNGQKESHWMWFIFPQIDGLGKSSTACFYAIKNIHEARAYLDHPVLGKRIIECCHTILKISGKSATEIFGYPDNMKLKSSMTLFAILANDPNSVFQQVLNQYFGGLLDHNTIVILDQQAKKRSEK